MGLTAMVIQRAENLDWWNKYLVDAEMLNIFKGWIGDYNALTKKHTRNYIERMGYTSVLDVGCGCCTEYHGYKNDGYSINYSAVDSCEVLVTQAIAEGIDANLMSAENLLFGDNSYEVVFMRHLLEHLQSFKRALEEAIRVASREVVIVFYLRPVYDKELTNYNNNDNIFNNRYNRWDIEQYLLTNSRVNRFRWESVGTEEILHIYTAKPKLIIPKIFHRVWMGKKPMPQEFIDYGRSWEIMHPDWEMKLWTEDNLFPLKNQKLFDNAIHVVQKCEIARLEIIYNIGGVYLDCDFECLKNIDDLLAGIEGFTACEDPGIFSMGIMGAVPGYKAYGVLVDGLEESLNKYKDYPINHQAGPMYATRKKDEISYITMFAPELFYPYSYREMYRKGESFPNAYAVHHWANSAGLGI